MEAFVVDNKVNNLLLDLRYRSIGILPELIDIISDKMVL